MEQQVRSDNFHLIPDPNEQLVAEYLLRKYPKTSVFHERTLYKVGEDSLDKSHQRKKGTLPDFEIEDKEGSLLAVLEVTHNKYHELKNLHTNIMSIVAPEIPYLVFCRGDLEVLSEEEWRSGAVIYERTENLYRLHTIVKPHLVFNQQVL